MLFVWTSEGGPLQYVALGLFLMQIAPNLVSELQRNFNWDLSSVLPRVAAGTNVNYSSALAGGIAGISVGLVVAWRFGHIRQSLAQAVHRARTQLQRTTGLEWSNLGVSCVAGVVAGFVATVCVSGELLRWMPHLSQLATLGSIFVALRNGPRRPEARRQAKLEELTDLVRCMPMEPFVAEEEYGNQSIAELKQMVSRRGVSETELHSIVDRQNLVDCLKKRRQYSDTCCICFESYQKGDLLRILPHCQHELHVECLDQWVYTFATNAAKLRQDPTCPLCKEGMKAKAT